MHQQKKLISIIIPAYNEELRIGSSLKSILAFTKTYSDYKFEIIVIDDGSKDNTVTLIKKVFLPKVKLIESQPNKGKGFALREGVAQANGEWIYICDADLASPIENIVLFFSYMKNFSCVIGSRELGKSNEERNFGRKILGKLGNKIINLFLDLQIEDTQCGFKMFNLQAKKEFLKVKVNRWGYDFEFLYLTKKAGLLIKEIPLAWEAKTGSTVTWKSYFRTLKELIDVWYRCVGFSHQFWQTLLKKSFIKYIIVGFITTFINLGAFYTLLPIITGNFIFPFFAVKFQGYQLVESIAYLVSVIFNFLAHKFWSFKSNQWRSNELLRYLVLLIFNYLVGLLLITIQIDFFNFPIIFAKLMTLAIIVTWNFLILKLLIYNQE